MLGLRGLLPSNEKLIAILGSNIFNLGRLGLQEHLIAYMHYTLIGSRNMTLKVIPYDSVPSERMNLEISINLRGACGTDSGVITP